MHPLCASRTLAHCCALSAQIPTDACTLARPTKPGAERVFSLMYLNFQNGEARVCRFHASCEPGTPAVYKGSPACSVPERAAPTRAFARDSHTPCGDSYTRIESGVQTTAPPHDVAPLDTPGAPLHVTRYTTQESVSRFHSFFLSRPLSLTISSSLCLSCVFSLPLSHYISPSSYTPASR